MHAGTPPPPFMPSSLMCHLSKFLHFRSWLTQKCWFLIILLHAKESAHIFLQILLIRFKINNTTLEIDKQCPLTCLLSPRGGHCLSDWLWDDGSSSFMQTKPVITSSACLPHHSLQRFNLRCSRACETSPACVLALRLMPRSPIRL